VFATAIILDRDCPPFKSLVVELHFNPKPSEGSKALPWDFLAKWFRDGTEMEGTEMTLPAVQTIALEQLASLRAAGFRVYSRDENWRYSAIEDVAGTGVMAYNCIEVGFVHVKREGAEVDCDAKAQEMLERRGPTVAS